MVKTRSRPFTSVFQKKGKQQTSTDENGLPSNKAVKIVEQGKRSAEDSPDNAPSRKRSAFGDITNATFNQQLGKDIKRKDANTTNVTRRESLKHGQTKTKAKSNKRRASVQTASHATAGFEVNANSLASEISNLQNPIELSSSQELVDSQSFESEEEFGGSRPVSSNSNDWAVSSLDGSTSAQAEGDKQEDDKALHVPLPTLDDQVDISVKPDVIDIDRDTSDPSAVSEYAYEIFNNMKRREECFPLTPYMDTQQEITPHMRAILVDWLVEVQECFELYHETLYLAVKLLDHFLERNTIKRQDLQLVGATTLLLSSKIEERHPPCMDDFIYICDDAYKQPQFIAMEKKIICSLEFDINIPIPYRFLRRFAKAALANIETLTLARFILESSLLDSQFIPFKASFMAASCLCLALTMKESGEWTPTLVHYTGYTKKQLRDCVLRLNAMNASPPNNNLMTVRSKYSHKVFHEVAKIPALDTLTMEI